MKKRTKFSARYRSNPKVLTRSLFSRSGNVVAAISRIPAKQTREVADALDIQSSTFEHLNTAHSKLLEELSL